MGERHHQRLADGSDLTLNAESALDVHFSGSHRLLSLARGDIFVRTAADAPPDAGPFRVDTVHGAANRDSPLVRQTTGATVGLGVSYTWLRSAARAQD